MPAGFFLAGSTRGPEVLVILGTAFVLGLVVGRLRAGDICSTPGCPGNLAKHALRCPRCGREIKGRINRLSEHAERAEELEPPASNRY